MKIILWAGMSIHFFFFHAYLVSADTNTKNLCTVSSSSASYQNTTKLECSYCCNPLLDKKEIKKSPVFVYSCSHIEHANCYASWQTMKGTCPTCRKSGGVTQCKTLEEVARVLQNHAFEEQRRLDLATREIQRLVTQAQTDQTQIRELTAQRDEALARFQSLNSRVHQLERNDALFKGTTLVTALVVAGAVGIKIIFDGQSTRSSTQ